MMVVTVLEFILGSNRTSGSFIDLSGRKTVQLAVLAKKDASPSVSPYVQSRVKFTNPKMFLEIFSYLFLRLG
jgi:hypothetical protein